MKKFKKSDIKFFLKSTKGLTKKYMIDCIFNNEIQSKWVPQEGDMMVGCTGNVFFISKIDKLAPILGGTKYYFGGGSCSRDGRGIANSTYCMTANESGEYWSWTENGIEKTDNPYHSFIKDFKFVPYPHETGRL